MSESPTPDTTDPVLQAGPPAAGRLPPGQLLGGRFRIVRFIARGGMGEVYEAEDEDLGGRVALKVVSADPSRSTAHARFRREVSLARGLNHPALCRIFDVGHHQEDGQPELTFLTMELLAGETVAARLARAGPLEPALVAAAARQLAEGLAVAHEAGIVHRDLKPGNVMLVPGRGGAERAVIMDFGLAREHAGSQPTLTQTGASVGTPAYMAPEQLSGDPATPRTDVYAFGLLLYEMLTGRLPFDPHTRLEAALVRLQGEVPKPSSVSAGLEERWDALLGRCLRRYPRDRFADGRELLAALRAHEERGSPGPRSWHRATAAAGLAAVLAAAVLARLAARPQAEAPATRPPLRLEQMTSSPGLDLQPAFSPDGRSLAYSSDRAGSFEIFVRPLTPGGREIQVTADGQQNFKPAWSPDGQWLAYHNHRKGGIWIVPALGGTPRQLTTFGARPAWSPDGRTLAFQSATEDVSWNALAPLPPSVLWTVAAAGGEPRALTRGGQPAGGHGSPAWSPRGDRLVFLTYDRLRTRAWLVDAAGAGLEMVPGIEARYVTSAAFAPGGRRLYLSISSESGGVDGIVSVALQDGHPTGSPVPISAQGPARIRQLSASPDGRRLLYGAVSLVSHLWTVTLDAATGEPKRPPEALTTGTNRSARPVFSPDGRRLAFYRSRTGGSSDVWVMDADGGNPRAVTTDAADDYMPSWFPGSARVAFLSNRSGRYAVWAADLDTGRETLARELGDDLDFAALAPDGRSVAYHWRQGSPTLNTAVAPLSGGAGRQVTFDKELAGFPVWSPDGRWLGLEVRRGGSTQVAVVPSAGGELELLTADEGESWPGSFSPDGERIAFAANREGFWNLRWVSRSTREQAQLTPYRKLNAYVRSPAWSPDGTRVVYEYAETVGNVFVLDGLAPETP